MFKCDKCGLCCESVSSSFLGKKLDRGDGICRFFNVTSRLCSIYENRLVFCNVDRCYEIFYKNSVTREEYYNLNYEVCRQLKEKYGK